MSTIQKRTPLALQTSKMNSMMSNKNVKLKRMNKSLVDCQAGSSLFQLSQNEIHFINTELNQAYEISMTIRNVSQNCQKIKIKPPKLGCFSLSYSKEGVIAPGLQIKVVVGFQNKNNQEVSDRIVLVSQDETQVEIPIYAYPQISKLVFDPFVNFGFIKVAGSKEIMFPMENIGTTSAEVRLQVHCIQEGCLKIEPQQFRLQPKERKLIKLTISGKEIGQVDGQIQIEPKQLSLSEIEFVANFCQFSRYVTNNQGIQIQQIILQPLFAGQKTKITNHLVNNSPKTCDFRISKKKVNDCDDPNQIITPQQFGKQQAEKILTVSPSLGQLEPYSAIKFNTDVQAKYMQNDLQIFCNFTAGKIKSLPYEYKQWTYFLTIHFSDEEYQQKILLKGVSIIPKVTLSSTFLKFGQVFLKEKSEKILTITNESIKPIQLKFSKSSNYKIMPQKLQINVRQSKQICLIFCPKIVGDSNEILTMKIGEFEFPFRVFGKGKFNTNDNLQISMLNSKVSQVKPEDLNPDYLQNQISIIKDGSQKYRKQMYSIDYSHSTLHFDISKNNNNSCAQVGFDSQSNSKFNKQAKNYKKTLKNKNGKQIKIDLSNLDSKQEVDDFPTLPKNQQEERIVSRELTSQELKNVTVGPIVIQIGDIFLKSVETRYFHICNFNNKAISIQFESVIIANLPMFENTPKNRQILAGESHGGLKIVFEALVQGQFRYLLQYILNGKHFFEVAVTGRVIQPYVTISKSEMKFVASQEDTQFERTESLSLTNNHKYPVNFAWSMSKDSLFKIVPCQGVVAPNSNFQVEVSHNFLSLPQPGGKFEQNLKLKVTHGKSNYLKCTSIVPECSCSCKPHQVNFKQISISKNYQQRVFLKNTGRNFTVFDVVVEKQIQGIVTAQCSQKTLVADQTAEILIRISASRTALIDSHITFIVRGGKPISLGVKANIIVPRIRIEQDQIDFGPTPVEGNPAVKTLSLVNESNISIDLDMRLQIDSFIYRCLKIGKSSDENLTIFESQQTVSLTPNTVSQSTSHTVVLSSKYKVFNIRVASKCRVNLLMQFTPEQVVSYNFLLPLFLNNSWQALAELQKQIKCKGIMNRLIASDKQINFGKIIMEQSLATYQKWQTIELRNPHQQAVEWWIDDKGFYPFSLEKKRGKLEGGQKQEIKVLFYNDSPGDYYRELHFFIDQVDMDISKSYLKVSVRASASYPEIYFNKPYLILPVVNLNEQSRGRFQILNGGYQNLNLKHVIVQEFSNIDIQLNYVNGSNLGVTKKKIDIEVSFVSDKPISFTIRIDFYDHNNRVFSIPVSGTSDNCILTLLQSEFEMRAHSDLPRELEMPKTSKSVTPELQAGRYLQVSKSCSYLRSMINSLICIQNPIRVFPDSLFEDDYQRLHQCLSYYSTIFEKIRPNWKKNYNLANKVNAIYDYFSQIIKSLKSEGAFLNQIRPQLLLPYRMYQEVIKNTTASENCAQNFILCSQSQYQQQKDKAWVILFYQIFRVYSRIQISKTKTTDFWAKFLQRQKNLISWLQQTYQQQAKLDQIKKTDRLKDLNDCEMLSALISKYTNIKIIEFYGRPIKGVKQKEKRCKKVIETLNQVGITTHVSCQDLMRSNPKQMLVFLQRLYLILPSYLQKGDPILFSCAFGQCLTKTIQISNPSKHPVTYIAKVQGSKAFSVQNDVQFTIESKKTHQVKIKYISNMNVGNNDATLTFSGKSQSKYTPSTFIFMLKSQTLGRISQKSIQVTGQLYEMFNFNMNVTNNFNLDGQFKVEIQSCEGNQNLPLSFYSQLTTIKIKKGQTMTLPMSFLPFSLQNQKCLAIFKDPSIGQFQYQIIGVVNQPQLSQQILRIRQVLYTNKKYHIDLSIPLKNDLLVKARRTADGLNQNKLQQASKDKKQIQRLISTERFFYPKLSVKDNYTVKIIPGNQMILLKTQTLQMGDIEQNNDSNHQESNQVHNSQVKQSKNQVIQANTAISKTQKNSDQGKEKVVRAEQKKIQLEVNMKYPIKDGSFILFLRNSSGTDVRKYQVLLNAVYKPLRYELEMRTAVNKNIVQPLPLINLTNDNNTYRVILSVQPLTNPSTHNLHPQKNDKQPKDISKNIFSIDCERQVVVRPRQQQVINLCFKPRLKVSYSAVLKMENITTQQIIQYEIVGIAQEPQAELLVYEQQVRKSKIYFIKIPFSKNQRCVVNKFTLEGAVYQKNFLITYDNSNFCFNFAPKIAGKFQGKLQIEDDHKMYAFRIQICVRDVIEGQLKIKTLQRKAGEASVKLPIGEWIIMKGDPSIISDQRFQIKDQNETYRILYYSIKPEQRSIPITFYCDKIGQVSFNMRVIVEQMPEIKLDILKVQLGKVHQQQISFENSDDSPMIVNGQSSDETVFYFEPKIVTVAAKSEAKAKLIYRPSSLEMEQGKVCFRSNKDSKWVYHMSGYGLLQSHQQVKSIETTIDQQVCQSLTFSNPFNKTVKLHITLENQTEPNAFKILLKASKLDLNYRQETAIPLALNAKEVKLHTAVLKIAISDKIFWKYRLLGKVVHRSLDNINKCLKAVCRQNKQMKLQFELHKLPLGTSIEQKKLRLSVRPLLPQYGSRIQNSLTIVNQVAQLGSSSNKVQYSIQLSSLKPFECPCEFQISDQNGCRWIQRFDVCFAAPPVDDNFVITTELNKVASVAFRLTNRNKQFSKFKAYFTSQSCMQFSVLPKQGDLEPYGRTGTLFEVSFAPTQYRNMWQGKLVIQTDESLWSYDVKGSLPLYMPPKGKSLVTSSMVKREQQQS